MLRSLRRSLDDVATFEDVLNYLKSKVLRSNIAN